MKERKDCKGKDELPGSHGIPRSQTPSTAERKDKGKETTTDERKDKNKDKTPGTAGTRTTSTKERTTQA